MSNKVTVFGAGSVVFSLGLVKDLCLTKELSGSHMCFMDINEESLDVIYNLGKRYAGDFLRQLKSIDMDGIRSKMEILLQADLDIKSSGFDPALLFETAVVRLCLG